MNRIFFVFLAVFLMGVVVCGAQVTEFPTSDFFQVQKEGKKTLVLSTFREFFVEFDSVGIVFKPASDAFHSGYRWDFTTYPILADICAESAWGRLFDVLEGWLISFGYVENGVSTSSFIRKEKLIFYWSEKERRFEWVVEGGLLGDGQADTTLGVK